MSLKIVVTGAGSGGHITPILAVAAELKHVHPDCQITYIGQRGDGLGDIPAENPNIDAVRVVRAGKFRRYHGEGWRQLLDIPTIVLNIRDAGYVVIGLWQSWRVLRRLRPDVIFIKGGFVGVPVGLAAAALHIPYVTHDSDAVPGLANRLIARWAARHAVALPKEVYSYPEASTVTTGIPLQHDFKPVTVELQHRYRREIDIPAAAKLVFIIGGGLGAGRINNAACEVVPHLLQEHEDLYVVHGVGRAHETAMKAAYKKTVSAQAGPRLQVFGYLSDIYRYSGAADVVVTRAGATNLAEFALQGKACLVIPHPNLTGGHQLKNAQFLQQEGAVEVLDQFDLESDPNRLAIAINQLLAEPERRQALGASLSAFAKPYATRDLAKLLLEVAANSQRKTA